MADEQASGEQINTEAVAVNESSKEETSLVGGAVIDEVIEQPEGLKDESQEVIKDESKVELQDFKLPEGVLLDEGFATEFKSVAQELNLNQEQAQKLVDLQSKFTQGYTDTLNNNFKNQVKAWGEETISELGPNYKQDMSIVAKAMENFGSPELRTLLNDTGLGNHKEVAKFFLKIGKSISEDKMKDSNMGKEITTKSFAEKHYPNTKS